MPELRKRISEGVSSSYGKLLDTTFPARCVTCHKEGSFICDACQKTTRIIGERCCQLCGEPVSFGGSLCNQCERAPLEIGGIRSIYYYEGAVKDAILQLKFHGLKSIVPLLGSHMSAYMSGNQLDADFIVPVPSHSKRIRERGYNQAELLARALASISGISVEAKTLRRIKLVRPQSSSSSREERRTNVIDTFVCSGEGVSGKRVLLVDDVCTTGYTLEACSRELRTACAAEVRALTVAREA